MTIGASHCGVVASCLASALAVLLAWVSSGSWAVSLCGSSGCSQGASLRVVPFARRVVGRAVAVARLAVVVALLGGVAGGAGGIACASLVSALPALSSLALPFALPVLSCGVVSCPVSPSASVWSAAACSWMARLARSMSPLARASACASVMMVSACVRASLMMRCASSRASLMMRSACSRACWMALSMAAVMPSSGLVARVVSLLFMIVCLLFFLLYAFYV